MLRDPRSNALVDNFASRWLELGKLPGVVPDAELYPEFDENLRDAMEQETRLFIGSQVRGDHSVMDLVTADYTYLNERLATHYGIRDIYGSHFRRVTFSDRRRGGLLGQSSLLTVTSYPNRTSVSDARTMAAGEPAGRAAATAAARHSCAPGRRRETVSRDRFASGWSCTGRILHARRVTSGWIRWGFRSRISTRSENGGARAMMPQSMPSASFPDGTRFEGIAGLRTLLVSHKEDFVRTLTGKLLAYATGRGLDHHDLPVIRRSCAMPRRPITVVVDHRRHRQKRAVRHGDVRALTGCRRVQGERTRLKEHHDRRKEGAPEAHRAARDGDRRWRCRCSTAWSPRSRRCRRRPPDRSTGSACCMCPTA